MAKIILATRNQHKVKELSFFLGGLPIEILTLNEYPGLPPLVEDGATFRENAVKKARQVFDSTGLVSLADDSGLEVFFLNGRPGVWSARYAGEETNDEANNRKLLFEMRGVAPRRRRAQFRAFLALVGNGIEEITEGECPGRLAESPRGTNGFGYDPIFLPDGFERTYAELTSDEKNRISHRSRAFDKMRVVLQEKILRP
ncbi:MAG TPA: RdgB/HAM1 family non-canonical purine NTP pyrophosphatase [Bacteroidota bacterium]|nr:RdgB/HAM1 family non-canonical purine NTP pyrophosphatase [Bacteroidota bacterium]